MVILKVTRIYTGRQKKSTAPELAPTALLQVSPRRSGRIPERRDETSREGIGYGFTAFRALGLYGKAVNRTVSCTATGVSTVSAPDPGTRSRSYTHKSNKTAGAGGRRSQGGGYI
jgi:hypothetical protein